MIKTFKENLNTVVFTSNYVLTKVSTIIYVAHHEDGAWEFWGKEIIDEEEVKLVSFGQIIEIDPTILEIADLPMEFNAIRENKNSVWRIISKN